MTTLEEFKEIEAKATKGPWDFSSHQSGTICVSMRQWVGPKSSKYGFGYLAAHINAFNIDFHDERAIDSEKFSNGKIIAISRSALPALIAVAEGLYKALANIDAEVELPRHLVADKQIALAAFEAWKLNIEGGK